MVKADDCICFVCNLPIKDLFNWKVLISKGGYDDILARKVNNKTVYIGKGLYRHSKCEFGSVNWKKNPKLRKKSIQVT